MPDDIVREARELRDIAERADQDNRNEMLADLRFAAGEQWPEDIRAARRAEGRPCEVFNRLGPYRRQVTGDIRLNPPSITVRARDSGADPKTAKTITGLIRNIQANSRCPWPYLVAADNAVVGGLGWLMLRWDYAYEDSFDMDFCIEAVPDPFSILVDPGAQKPCWEDAQWGIYESYLMEREFKARFPKASLTDWDADACSGGWRVGERIRIAEYWRKVPERRTLLYLPDGRMIDATDLPRADIERMRDEAVLSMMRRNLRPYEMREREALVNRVEMRLLNGVEELQEPTEWPGRYLPMVPVRGEEINCGDRVVRFGLVRHARAPQMLYNIQRNAYVEAVGMAPKPKWLVTPDMIAGHEGSWRAANTSAFPYLPYNPDAGRIPERVAPDMPAASLLQDIALAAQDIEAAMGIFRDQLGKPSNAESGRAILSRQREGDVGTYVYIDNLRTAVEHVGCVLVDAIPRVYDTERQIRILGEDGAEEFVTINQRGPDGQIVNDLSVGRYDVVASTGPSFSTRREEARESMIAFMQAMPQAIPLVADLFAKYQDWPGGEEIAARFRKMAIAQGVTKPDPQDPEEVAAAQAAAQQRPADPNLLLAQAEMAKAQAQMQRAQADAQVKMAEARIEMERLMNERVRLAIEAQKAGVDMRVALAEAAAKAREVDIKAAEAAHGMRADAADAALRAMDLRQRAMMRPAPAAPAA